MVRPAVRAAVSEGAGQSTDVMQSRMGPREGSHAQMPRTFRLSFLRIEVRLTAVMPNRAQVTHPPANMLVTIIGMDMLKVGMSEKVM